MNQRQYSQTSSGVTPNHGILDRESGRTIVIQYPSFDLMMSASSLSLKTDMCRLSPDKLTLMLKCLLIIQALPKAALEETYEELEEIYRFYSDRLSQAETPMIPASSLKGTLRAVQVRPPIVLEP
ncbi:MAG: hypothetical protein WBA43_22245 [Elainellaceae cyanobacterium]